MPVPDPYILIYIYNAAWFRVWTFVALSLPFPLNRLLYNIALECVDLAELYIAAASSFYSARYSRLTPPRQIEGLYCFDARPRARTWPAICAAAQVTLYDLSRIIGCWESLFWAWLEFYLFRLFIYEFEYIIRISIIGVNILKQIRDV